MIVTTFLVRYKNSLIPCDDYIQGVNTQYYIDEKEIVENKRVKQNIKHSH